VRKWFSCATAIPADKRAVLTIFATAQEAADYLLRPIEQPETPNPTPQPKQTARGHNGRW
jgi:hypothetical protein